MERKQRRSVNTWIIISIILIFTLQFCTSHQTPIQSASHPEVSLQHEKPFINKPIPGTDIPFTSYRIKGSKTSVITHSTGSKIHIPANAFVDKKGNHVKGEVTILYREMHNAWDILVSGIPMMYKKDTLTYQFESAGMFDIRGSVNDQPVFIAPGKSIGVDMVSYNRSDRFNKYYLDTVSKNWVDLGKSKIKPPKKSIPDICRLSTLVNIPCAPLQPRSADSIQNILVIKIENRKDFPEFNPFESLRFEVVESQGEFGRIKEPMQCSKPEITPFETKPGYYKLRMLVKNGGDHWINWLVRPAYSGFDYQKAMSIYRDQQLKYKEELKRQEEQAKLIEQQLKRDKAVDEIYRVVDISKFGIYNCDAPFFNNWKQVSPKFVTAHGEKLDIHEIMVIDSIVNGVIRYNLDLNPTIRLDLKASQKLVGVANDTIIYACQTSKTDKDFTTREYKVKMERFGNANELEKFVKDFTSNKADYK